MEEAETLSTRLAIMTKGGRLACQGTTLQIKNEHGQIFHVDLSFKTDEIMLDDDYDDANLEEVEERGEENIRSEIFGEVEWKRAQAIRMFQNRGLTHLAAQIQTQGVFCPKELKAETSVLAAKDLWNWYYMHHQLLKTLYKLLLDRRIISIYVLANLEN